MSAKEKKALIIDSLQDVFSRCKIGVLTDYRGLSAAEMTNLRRRFREAGVEYRVVKNTLARFAAQRAGKEELAGFFEGPVAIAFGYGDVTEPARVLAAYIEDSKVSMSIKGGFLPERLLTVEEINTLSKLPSREILLAMVVGGVQSPISALVGYLSAPLMGVIGALQSRIQQMEGG
ncbi:MAG TPA: 50S ribosomal protein L10 [Dehalococcoidia bacterium]|nr:50S ribosomal protein L10 [Dehalococcoidia bacterium]